MSGVSRSSYGRSTLIHSVYRHATHLPTARLSAVVRLSILQKVHLEMLNMDWSTRIFNGLTELTLRCTPNYSRKSWDGVLLILRQSPHLRRLHLSEVLPSASVSAPSVVSKKVAKPISLPRLEELNLGDSIAWMMLLLVHLEFPKSTIVRLDCIFDNIHDISTLLSHIPDGFSHPSSSPLPQSVKSALTELRYLNLQCFENTWKLAYGMPSRTDGDLFLLAGAASSFDSQIASTHVGRGLDPDDFLQWFRVFPLAHVNMFTLHTYLTSDIDDKFLWAEVFQEASELCIIRMEHGCVEGLIHALEPRDGIIPVPTLTDIWFSDVKFRPGECSENRFGLGYLECLCSALTSRAWAGLMLQRLGIKYCPSIMEHDVAELSKVVGRVEWA